MCRIRIGCPVAENDFKLSRRSDREALISHKFDPVCDFRLCICSVGHFVPATSHRVWQGNQDGDGLYMNLQGVGVGNGLTNPLVQYQYYAQMAYNYTKERLGHPVVTLEVHV